MSFSKLRPSIINMEKIAMSNEPYVTQTPSPMLSARRKKKRTKKTNQQIIQESHEQLLGYIDTVDGRVQQIIRTYEAQFLSAYQEHIKRVREEMEDIKKRSLSSANSESAYVQRIEVLQKQLIIFRQQSLRLFSNLTKKDKEINLLNFKIKELQTTIRQQQNKIFTLTKKSKENQVAFEKVKQQYLIENKQSSKGKRFTKSQHKHYPDLTTTPFAKQTCPDPDQSRPYSTQLRSNRTKNISLKIDSHRKRQNSKESADALWIRQKIEQKVGNTTFVPINTVIDLFSEKKMAQFQTKRDATSSFRKARTNYMMKMENKKSSCLHFDNEVMQKSKQMAENNELKQVLKNSIEEVRKDLTRRTKTASINFFKENGPKGYEQFKKVDHFTLLQLLLNNQKLLKGFFKLIFDTT